MPKMPLVINCYTENSPYAVEVLHLIASCQKWDIEAEIEGFSSKGSWELNCAFKPFFIRKKLLERKRPVFWVDADAIFRKKPDFSFLKESDVAFRTMEQFYHVRNFRYNSAAFFINYTAQGIKFANQWCDYCQEKIDLHEDLAFIDQTSLIDLTENNSKLKVYPLPIAYCKVFDFDASLINDDDVVIEQFQASRRFKRWEVSDPL